MRLRSFWQISVIVLALLLSLLAGLFVSLRPAKGEELYHAYLPFVMSRKSKIGIAPGGYFTGSLELLSAPWSYRWNNEWYPDRTEWIDMIRDRQHLDVPIRSGTILGFNEIDRAGQADLSSVETAKLWHEIEARYPDKELVSPACSQFNPGCIWEMVAEYEFLYGSRPRFDGIAVHYYKWDESMLSAQAYLEWFRSEEFSHGYTVPLWLTETGACGVDEEKYFYEMAEFVEATNWLKRAAWYKIGPDAYDTGLCSSLIAPTGELTPVGRGYVSWVTWP